MSKFTNWEMKEERRHWKNMETGTEVTVSNMNQRSAPENSKWRVKLEKAPDTDLNAEGLFRREKDAVKHARKWMDRHPLSGLIDLVLGKAEDRVKYFEEAHADLRDEAWATVEELLYTDLEMDSSKVSPELEETLVNEVMEEMEAVAR